MGQGPLHGAAKAGRSTELDSPTLRGGWATPPYLHRGQAANLIKIFNTSNAPGTTNHAWRFQSVSE